MGDKILKLNQYNPAYLTSYAELKSGIEGTFTRLVQRVVNQVMISLCQAT